MKNRIRGLMFRVAGAMLALSLISAPVACKTGQGQYNPTTGIYDPGKPGDPFVVNAQRTRGIALEAFDQGAHSRGITPLAGAHEPPLCCQQLRIFRGSTGES